MKVHAARWTPEMALEFVSLIPLAGNFGMKENLVEYCKLCSAITDRPAGLEPVLERKFAYNRLLALVNIGQGAEALEAYSRFELFKAEHDGLSEIAARLRAMAAVQTKKELID